MVWIKFYFDSMVHRTHSEDFLKETQTGSWKASEMRWGECNNCDYALE